jgi:hypothetical protein
MYRIQNVITLAVLFTAAPLIAQPNTLTPGEKEKGWHLLFDGESLNGWKAGENPDTFSVEDGCIVVHGPRAHLFYMGSAEGGHFRNFDMKLQVKTFPQANSGVYFHTGFQEQGWPKKGYEVQINSSHRDVRRTASLWGVRDQADPLVEDGNWFTLRIRVVGRRVRTWVNGKLIIDYIEESPPERSRQLEGRVLSGGTFALQGHDPDSRTLFRSIKVRALP